MPLMLPWRSSCRLFKGGKRVPGSFRKFSSVLISADVFGAQRITPCHVSLSVAFLVCVCLVVINGWFQLESARVSIDLK